MSEINDIESAPLEGEFLAETKEGDWLKVTNQPDVFKTGKRIVVHGLSGKFWAAKRWMQLPPAQEDNTNKVFKCYCGKTEIVGRLGCCKYPDCIPY